VPIRQINRLRPQGRGMSMDIRAVWATIQQMINDIIAALPTLGLALLVLALFALLAAGFKALVTRLSAKYRRHRNLGLVLGRLSQWFVTFIGILVALSIVIPTFKAGDLIQLLGISGVAIGFAFRDILQNFLAGILLLLTEPFRIGDQIVVQNYEGTVEDIQTRATMMRTYDGRRIVIPNAELFTESVTVNTAFERRRLEYDVGIGYGDDIDRAKALILEAMNGVGAALKEPPPEALVVKLADSSVIIRARWWITPPRRANALDMQDQVLTAIRNTLTAHGIDLPFPTQQILFHDQTEDTDGDRSRQREGWPAGNDEVPSPRGLALALAKLVETWGKGEARTTGQG
jgi:small-conductance mechanosensitive channel